MSSGFKKSVKVSLPFAVAIAVFCVFIVGALAQPQPPEGAEYVGNQQCKICHNKPATGAQWTKWSEMGHSKAIEVLKTDEAKKVAADLGMDVAPHESPDCLRCHVTAYDVEKKAAPAALKMEDSVQCESCHGPASLHVEAAKKVMFSKEESDVELGSFLCPADDATCRTCHNQESPTWKPDRYTLEDGTPAGFDFEQAWKKIAHPNPEKQAAESGA